MTAAPEVLDARALPCAGKHAQIFRRWAQLGIGGSFVLVNDHRPAPLQHQFERLVPGCFDWCEVPAPPGAFAVRLTRLRPDPASFDPARVGGCGGPDAGRQPADGELLMRLQLDYRPLGPVLARERSLAVAQGLADGVALEVALVAPDPALDEALTVLGLTFRGGPLADGTTGWSYLIRRPAASSAAGAA
jgi:uncharacterized protein (DUF2249 family)